MFADLGAGKRCALIGLGLTNQAVAEYLAKLGVSLVGYDQKTRSELGTAAQTLEELGVDLKLGPESFTRHLTGFDYVFVSPGIRADIPLVKAAAADGAIITNEIDLLLHLAPGLVIGITGSSGKTTTTSLVGHILQQAGRLVLVGGNIGEPLITKVPEMTEQTILVLELSSFQLMNVRKSPQLALITNITPNHLDYHTSMQEYIEAKKQIFSRQEKCDTVVLNADDPVLMYLAAEAPGQLFTFSRQRRVTNGACLEGDQLVLTTGEAVRPVLPISEIPLRGAHNVENVLAAAVLTDRCGVTLEVIREAIRDFRPVEHRLELVRELDGVKYYNDSIATSPARAIAGIRSFSEPVILIAGGYDKKLPFDEFVREFPGRVRHLLLLGATAPLIAKLVDALPDGPDYTLCASLEEAVNKARQIAVAGEVVLLSPACASFDMFPNYRERGRVFKELVSELK